MIKGTNDNLNDAQGKIHELGTLLAFCGGDWSNTGHFRASGETPLDVFNVCANTLGHDATMTILADSSETHLRITQKLVEDGYMATVNAYWAATWTSLEDSVGVAGDHEKYTGIKDLNSEADIMITTDMGPIGLSLKYGTSKNITLKNPGKDWLETMLGLDGEFDSYKNAHDVAMRYWGFTGTADENHVKYKLEKKAGSLLAKEAEKSGLSYRRMIASLVRYKLSRMKSDDVEKFVLELCANETVFPHFRSHTRRKGEDVDYHISHIVEHSRKCADQYDSFHVESSESMSSTVIAIKARHKVLDAVETVANLAIKARSGPMKGWNGVFTAPMLKERRRKKKVLKVFDLDDTLLWYDDDESPRVQVFDVDTGEQLFALKPSEYTEFIKQPNHRFEYHEFASAEILENSGRPIVRVLEKMAKAIDKGEHVALVTARPSFDDMDRVRRFFNFLGINVENVPIYCMGESVKRVPSMPETKMNQIIELIDNFGYSEVHFYEDSRRNLEAFLAIPYHRPDVKVNAWLVKHNHMKNATTIRKRDKTNVMAD